MTHLQSLIELVWKVARSTCAGPMLFSEFNNYVDGGVLCNNPTEHGVTTIQNYHWEKDEKLPISLVVSVGSGMYPEEKLGNLDVQDISLANLSHLKHRVINLVDLFMNAVSFLIYFLADLGALCMYKDAKFYMHWYKKYSGSSLIRVSKMCCLLNQAAG